MCHCGGLTIILFFDGIPSKMYVMDSYPYCTWTKSLKILYEMDSYPYCTWTESLIKCMWWINFIHKSLHLLYRDDTL